MNTRNDTKMGHTMAMTHRPAATDTVTDSGPHDDEYATSSAMAEKKYPIQYSFDVMAEKWKEGPKVLASRADKRGKQNCTTTGAEECHL